jgi:NTE family protein
VWADAIVEGGGVNGIGLLGALCVAEEKGYRWKRVAGSSAGSAIATLIAAGYKSHEIYNFVREKNLSQLTTPSWYQRIPYLGPFVRLNAKKGLYSGDLLEEWIRDLLIKKGISTFGDFPPGTDLHIIASDITRGKLLILPRDLAEYGINPQKMSVSRVVCMSCAIPFFFEPLQLIHHPSGTSCYIVDGGVLSNFPIWLFDNPDPRWPTFGFRSCSPDVSNHQIKGVFSLFSSIFLTMMEAHDRRHILEQDQVRTIQVPTNLRATDFLISKELKEEQFQSGREAAKQFFQSYTFGNYLAVRGIHRVNYKIRSKNPCEKMVSV